MTSCNSGSDNGRAKLAEADVRAIRELPYRRGLIVALALRYGVDHGEISRIRAGKQWTSVEAVA